MSDSVLLVDHRGEGKLAEFYFDDSATWMRLKTFLSSCTLTTHASAERCVHGLEEDRDRVQGTLLHAECLLHALVDVQSGMLFPVCTFAFI